MNCLNSRWAGGRSIPRRSSRTCCACSWTGWDTRGQDTRISLTPRNIVTLFSRHVSTQYTIYHSPVKNAVIAVSPAPVVESGKHSFRPVRGGSDLSFKVGRHDGFHIKHVSYLLGLLHWVLMNMKELLQLSLFYSNTRLRRIPPTRSLPSYWWRYCIFRCCPVYSSQRPRCQSESTR